MAYYVGFLKNDLKHYVVFKSLVKPQRGDFKYFNRVMGPYVTEEKARKGLVAIRRVYGEYGYSENPIKGLMTKDGIRKAIALSRKVVKTYGILRKQNPGKEYHDQKFMIYLRELEKYVVGSVPYIATLAKAYEHLESAKVSMREESVR